MAIRPFTLADIEGVNALHDDVHWPVPSFEQWHWLARNPSQPENAPLGWVIDNDGRIDGFVGNYRRTAYRGRKRHSIASAYSVLVSPRAKGSLRELLKPFFAQQDVTFTTILNANELASPIYRKLGLAPLPHPTHDQKLSWTLAPTLALIARGLRVAVNHWPSLADKVGECFAPRAVAQFDPRSIHWPRNVHLVEDLSDNSAIGQFWENLRAEERFVTDRSPATLRWYVQAPDSDMAPLILGYHDESGLVAYALAQISKTRTIDVPVLEVLDIAWLSRAPAQAVPSLIRALQQAGYKMAVIKVRIPVVTAALLDALGPKRRTARIEGGWGHAFTSAASPDDYADWMPTAFDSSDGFTLRRPPRKAVKSRRSHVETPVLEA